MKAPLSLKMVALVVAVSVLVPVVAQPVDTATKAQAAADTVKTATASDKEDRLPDEFKGWKIADWAAVIQAFLAVAVTVSTYVLWIQSTKQIKAGNRMMQANYTSNVYRNFREIYMEYIKDDDQRALLTSALGKSKDELIRDYSATFLINHAYELYVYNELDLIPAKLWHTIETDMKDLYGWPFVSERWHKVKNLYPAEYGTFLAEKLGVVQPKPNTPMKRSFTVVHSMAALNDGNGCGGGNCPTIYQTEGGAYVIQGYVLSNEEKTSLGLPTGEDAIEVPKEFLEAFLKGKA